MKKKIVVIFDLNEPQWEAVQRVAKLEPGWHYCDLSIRYNGEDRMFEADFMRAFFQQVRKEAEVDK